MSKYTTELRYIIDTLGTGSTREEKIATAADSIFTNIWTTEDSAYKTTLEAKILRHYYMREIGAETFELWKFQLNTLLSEIMPKYNAIYKSLESWSGSLLDNVNVTETQSLSNTQSTTNHATTADSSTSDTSSSAENSGSSENKGTGNSDAWQEYQDTPQGSLQNLENGTYLTNATRNRSTSDTDNTSTNTAMSSTSSKTTTSSTTDGNSTGSANTTEDYVKKIYGKNSGSDFIETYLKLVQAYNDVDELIINECNACFINLWE